MRGICEVLYVANSAFHGTRLDIGHVSAVMDELLEQAEQRYGIVRSDIAPQTVFVSHETYTHVGGSALSKQKSIPYAMCSAKMPPR